MIVGHGDIKYRVSRKISPDSRSTALVFLVLSRRAKLINE